MKALFQPERLLAWMEDKRVEHAWVSVPPPVYRQHLTGRAGMMWTDYLNAGLERIARASNGRLSALMHLPTQDPDLAASIAGAMNADGVRLFVYHDAAGYKGLTFRKVHIGSDQLRRFEDNQVQIDVEGESINQGYVVATHPLSESHWHPFHPGELIVLAGGQPVFSSHRRPKAAKETSKEHS